MRRIALVLIGCVVASLAVLAALIIWLGSLLGIAVGDRIQMIPGFGPSVREIEPDHHILSGGEADTWCLLVEPTPEGRSRLVSRWRQDRQKSIGTFIWSLISDPGAFVMERKMLRTIRNLAEGPRIG